MSKFGNRERERRGRTDQTGRRAKLDERHVRLYDWMMDSRAWASLSPADRAVYIEIERLYHPTSADGGWPGNNGKIAVSVRSLALKCRISKDTAARSLRTLEERGFIVCVTPGGFSRKDPHASEWRLTRAKCDVTGESATTAFMRWKPAGENAERGPTIRTARSENRDSRATKAA